MKKIIVVVFLIMACLTTVYAEERTNKDQSLTIEFLIPIDQKTYSPDKLVAGGSWSRAKVTFIGNKDLKDVNIIIKVPESLDVSIPVQEVSVQRSVSDYANSVDNTIKIEIDEIKSGESKSILLDVKPPESIPKKTSVDFEIKASYSDPTGIREKEVTKKHKITIIPPPSWITYGTLIISILLFISAILFSRKSNLLERFSTIDLITIALLAALIGVVFRWFWQTFNDLLGPFGGLLFTIPTAALMIVALQMVRKPGTATLLFIVDQLVGMVIWGSNITVWLGWYMLEGVIVDILVIIFGMDYADRK
ncbi:MAG TPA: hypothetical protein EYP22_03100, partial [Methanosarcinales archaeon]|nr:hypothetical protein [Methanosarcinales archaeon]